MEIRDKTAASLAFFRILFGALMLVAQIRFVARGWVDAFYVRPGYWFSFFEWLKPLPQPYLLVVFYALIGLSVLILIGWGYRWAIWAFFVLFTYVELLDKAVYLNHYYLVSLTAFLMGWLPMNAACSVDSLRTRQVPVVRPWMLTALRFQVGTVYFFGGIAKLKPDWLLEAQPLRIWLAANEHIPVVGPWLREAWVAYVISWAAMLFDLSAPFLLSFRKTRPWAYGAVVVFHLLTHYLFYIGMFPWFMMGFALIFFPSEVHERLLQWFPTKNAATVPPESRRDFRPIFLSVFLGIQCLLPFREWLYPGNPLWTEQGYRFSWNIMLMEKNASLEYHVTVRKTGDTFTVAPKDFLTGVQARQLSFQPDMILQFAHYLHHYYLANGLGETEVRAECWASLNGRPSRLLIDPAVNLVPETDSFRPKSWILPE